MISVTPTEIHVRSYTAIYISYILIETLTLVSATERYIAILHKLYHKHSVWNPTKRLK